MAKWASPLKSAGASVQSTAGSRGVRISGSIAGCTMFGGGVKSTHSICQFPLHFSHASPCAITLQLESTDLFTGVCVCVCVCMCAVLYSLYLGAPSFHTCISHLFIFCMSISSMYLCDMLRLVPMCPNYYFLFHTPHHRLPSCLGQSVLMLCRNRWG